MRQWITVKDHESLRHRGYPRPQIGFDSTAKQEVEKGTLTRNVLLHQLIDQVKPRRTLTANNPVIIMPLVCMTMMRSQVSLMLTMDWSHHQRCRCGHLCQQRRGIENQKFSILFSLPPVKSVPVSCQLVRAMQEQKLRSAIENVKSNMLYRTLSHKPLLIFAPEEIVFP